MTETVLCPVCARQYGHLFGCSLPKLQDRIKRLLKNGYTAEQINKQLDNVLKTPK